jgi:hypothetical protein
MPVAQQDKFDVGRLRSPAYDAVAVTPSDTVPLPQTGAKLYVGGAGDVTLVTEGGTTITFKAVPVGTTLWQRHTQVKATGTGATFLVSMF